MQLLITKMSYLDVYMLCKVDASKKLQNFFVSVKRCKRICYKAQKNELQCDSKSFFEIRH